MVVKKKNKILHLHWGFPPTIGGVETHLSILLPQLVSKGYEVSLITSDFDEQENRSTYKGADIFRTQLFDLNWLAKRGLNGIESDLLELYTKQIDTFSPNLIHTHNMHYFSKPHIKILEKICKKKGIPLLLTAHNVWNDLLFLELTRDIDWSHIITVSHYIRMELSGIGIDPERTTTIHHGLDLAKYRKHRAPLKKREEYSQIKNKKVIFHPARMGLAKGCDVIIKAMPAILERFPETFLILAGSKNIIDWTQSQDSDIAYFLELIKGLGIEKNVMIKCFSLEEMPFIYQLFDVVVYPSSNPEPFGLAILEAFASSKPIIVTDVGGMPEIVQDQISGYVIPNRNVEALVSRIISLLESEKLRKRLGETGRQIVETQYTKEIMCKKHRRIYDKIITGR